MMLCNASDAISEKSFAKCTRLFLITLILLVCCYAHGAERLKLLSPSGKIAVEFMLTEGEARYRVLLDEIEVIKPSALGFEFKQQPALFDNLKITDHETDKVRQTWKPVWGNFSSINNHYNQLTINLQEQSELHRKLVITLRVFDDGVGFRYLLPEQKNLNQFSITSERTEFTFTGDHTTWWIPADYDSYEHLYAKSQLSEVPAANTPITFKSKNGVYLSLHEAALTDYAGMTLLKSPTKPFGLTSELVPWPDGVKVKGRTPFKTPWRTIQISKSLAGLVASNLIENLNEPSVITDTSWIEPMKYVGIWWAMHMRKYTWHAGPKHGATTENSKQYIDFASKNNVGAVLVEGWNLGWETWHSGHNQQDFTRAYPDFDLAEVVAYGKRRGVAIMGHHETGGNIPLYEKQIEQAFALYHSHGVRALKTGYAGKMHPKGQYHHGQYMVNHYRKVLETAAKYEIMLNAHEPIKPTGLRRTYPNMMTREGARGMEWNGWSEGNPPEHTVTLPFTRLLAGPLDYTPGIFNIKFDPQQQYRVYSTLARQLAMYVVIYSPLQMAADMIENYHQQKAFEFIRNVPVSWDESTLLAGDVGDYVSMARRKGDEWFVGTMTDEHPRILRLALDFLDDETNYVARIYGDSLTTDYNESPEEIEIAEYTVNSKDELAIAMASAGGSAIHFYPQSEQKTLPSIRLFNDSVEKRYLRFSSGGQYGEVRQLSHKAVGKKINHHSEFDNKYSGGGALALIDGVIGGADYKSLWQGYRENNLDVTIDLTTQTAITEISIGFMQSVLHSIMLPTTVEFMVSADGENFKRVSILSYVTQKDTVDYQQKRFHASLSNVIARYVRVTAKNMARLPDWHIRSGQEAFIFADEIIIE